VTPASVRSCLIAGSLLGGVAVAAGAFGAHGLAATLTATGQAANWQTACTYCMYHALGLVAAGLVASLRRPPCRLALTAGWCFLLGTLIFSGCLAALALSGLKILGAIVPIGGVLLIAGWVLLAIAAARLPATD
jgi:uncharacterized membrane protein YgdD (TMEM256/DUF423 family)